MLIAKITDSDFFGGEPQYVDGQTGYNVRGVLFDGKGNIALMKPENSEYYKLPGGRIEITETTDQAFLREISEQTGYNAEIVGYLGWVEEHKAKKNRCTVSHCFVGKITDDNCNEEVLQNAQERLGFTLQWEDFNNAIAKIKELLDGCKEYQACFTLKRELLILETTADKFPVC